MWDEIATRSALGELPSHRQTLGASSRREPVGRYFVQFFNVYGQVPVAFVEARPESGRDLEGDILASCRVSLAKFKVPRRVVILAELPRVGNAKIARPKLRQML